MRRRDFLALMGAGAVWPQISRAQQARPNVRRVALVSSAVPTKDMVEGGASPTWTAFVSELRHLGVVEGDTTLFERHSAMSDSTAYDRLALRVVASNPDLIFMGGTFQITRAAAVLTGTIPIVFTVADGLATGLVTNLARPGANVTGTNQTAGIESEAKLTEILHEAAPAARRMAYINAMPAMAQYRAIPERAAAEIGVGFVPLLVDDPALTQAYRQALEGLVGLRIDALQVGTSGQNNAASAQIAEACDLNGIPAISPYSTFAESGGLLSYGANLPECYRAAARYVVRILNGERPGDLPVIQPTAFDLSVNLRTAKRLGLQMSATLLAQATQVFE